VSNLEQIEEAFYIMKDIDWMLFANEYLEKEQKEILNDRRLLAEAEMNGLSDLYSPELKEEKCTIQESYERATLWQDFKEKKSLIWVSSLRFYEKMVQKLVG